MVDYLLDDVVSIPDYSGIVKGKNETRFARKQPTVCVTGLWAGWVTAWEQDKPDARKILVNRADSHKSSARGVGKTATDDRYRG